MRFVRGFVAIVCLGLLVHTVISFNKIGDARSAVSTFVVQSTATTSIPILLGEVTLKCDAGTPVAL